MSNETKSKLKTYLTAPNLITSVRIIGAIVLIFLPFETDMPFTDRLPFYIVYGICGVSDGVDGFVARRTNTVSAFGKKLDSASDLLFYLVMAYKLFGELKATLHPAVFWTVIGLMVMRLGIYLFVALTKKSFLTTHSIFNKATGFVVFMIPYTITFDPFFFYYSILGCVIAFSANVYEIVNIARGPKKEKETATAQEQQ